MKVHVIETGKVRIKTAQIEARRSPPLSLIDILNSGDWSGWLPTYAFAIETDRDGVIVVDSGQAAHLLEEEKHSLHPFHRLAARFQIEPEQEIGPQLRALGIGPKDVRKLVLTHLHIDHDAGIAHFPDAEIFAAPGEIAQARGFMGRVRSYLPQRWPGWFDPHALVLDEGPYGPFAASKRLDREGRLVAVATPGHTANHLSVIMEDDDVTLFLAGDTSYTQDLMLSGKADGVSPAPDVARHTLGQIRAFAAHRPTVYLPSHDPDGAARFAARQVVPAAGDLVEAA